MDRVATSFSALMAALGRRPPADLTRHASESRDVGRLGFAARRPGLAVSSRCSGDAARRRRYAWQLRRRIDAELAELAVERRAANPEPPRHLGHAAAIMTDGEADDVSLDLFQRPEMAIGRVQRDSRRAIEGFVVLRLGQPGREVRGLAVRRDPAFVQAHHRG